MKTMPIIHNDEKRFGYNTAVAHVRLIHGKEGIFPEITIHFHLRIYNNAHEQYRLCFVIMNRKEKGSVYNKRNW